MMMMIMFWWDFFCDLILVYHSMNPVLTSLSRNSFKSVSSELRIPIDFNKPRSPDSTAIRMFRRCSRSLRIRCSALPKSSIVSLSVKTGSEGVPKKIDYRSTQTMLRCNQT